MEFFDLLQLYSKVVAGGVRCEHCGELIVPEGEGFMPWADGAVHKPCLADAIAAAEASQRAEQAQRRHERQRLRSERSELARARWRESHPPEPPDPNQLALFQTEP